MPDILFIVALALVIFGPKKLPELASHAGKYLAQFSRMKRELLQQMEAEVGQIRVTEGVRKVSSESAANPLQEP